VFTLQRILGHTSLDMVRRYVALADTDVASRHELASPADRLLGKERRPNGMSSEGGFKKPIRRVGVSAENAVTSHCPRPANDAFVRSPLQKDQCVSGELASAEYWARGTRRGQS
jgi:hypothetical protein